MVSEISFLRKLTNAHLSNFSVLKSLLSIFEKQPFDHMGSRPTSTLGSSSHYASFTRCHEALLPNKSSLVWCPSPVVGWTANVCLSSQLCIQCHQFGSLKSARVGIFTILKWAPIHVVFSPRNPSAKHLPTHHFPGLSPTSLE